MKSLKKIVYAFVLSLLLLKALPVYAATDVNIVPPPPPAAPTNISITGITDTSAQISWPAVTSALQYTIYLDGQAYTGSNYPQAILTGLTPYTNYTAYVTANNSGGDSPGSALISFKTLSPAPIALTNPQITTTSTTAKLIWQPLASIYNITKYSIYLDGQLSTQVTSQTGMQSAALNNLSLGTHTVTISATNDNKEGPQSQPVTFTISTVPMPIDVNAYNKTSDSIWLSWQPVPGAASYNVLLNGQFLGQTYQPSYILKNLSTNTSYQISVTTLLPDGEQSQASKVNVITEDYTQPLDINNIKNKISVYIYNLGIYIEILFAFIAALAIAKNIGLSFK